MKPSKQLKIALAVLMVISLAYAWLMIRFRAVIPSDIFCSVINEEWALDSASVHMVSSVFDPGEIVKLTRRDTAWHLSGAIYAHNNLRKFLSVEAIQIQDHSAHFSADAQIRWLIPPSRTERTNPHYFMTEPFGLVYELQWPATHLSPTEFKRFIDKSFDAHSLTILVRTNHGNLAINPRGYTTISWSKLIYEYPPPR